MKSENKTTVPSPKALSAEPSSVSSTEPTMASMSVEQVSSSTTENPPKLTKDQLSRLRRQLNLENELSSAMDESENLGIEQVSTFYFELIHRTYQKRVDVVNLYCFFFRVMFQMVSLIIIMC